MEPLLIILVPGVLGGVVLAALIASKRIALRPSGVARPLASPSPSLINMAHIPVAGGGGLGLVAAVIAVAISDPRLRGAVAIAALCGVVLAAVLIARRRDRGPLTSSGDDAGPHSLLGLGRPGASGAAATPPRPDLPAPGRDHAPFAWSRDPLTAEHLEAARG